jgi:hypothetical protein
VPGVSCVAGERGSCAAQVVGPDRSFRANPEGYYDRPAVGRESLGLTGTPLEAALR